MPSASPEGGLAVSARACLMLVNTGAGRGRTLRRLERLLKADPPPGTVDLEIVEIESPPDVRRALSEAEPDRLVIAVGGDGTVSMLAREMIAQRGHATLGIVPLGTGNILARELGISAPRLGLPWTGRVDLARVPTRLLDAMRTTHPDAPLALISVSTGFEGAFIHRYQRSRGAGRLGAAIRGAADGLRRWPVSVQVDGTTVAEPDLPTFAAGLYATRCYAAGIVMSPEASLSDGIVEAVAYRDARAWWSAVARGFVHRARTTSRGVLRRGWWRSARLEAEAPLQIDGEPVEPRAVEVTLAAGAIRVMAPSNGGA